MSEKGRLRHLSWRPPCEQCPAAISAPFAVGSFVRVLSKREPRAIDTKKSRIHLKIESFFRLVARLSNERPLMDTRDTSQMGQGDPNRPADDSLSKVIARPVDVFLASSRNVAVLTDNGSHEREREADSRTEQPVGRSIR